MTPCCPSPLPPPTPASRHDSSAVPISIEHTSSWNNRRRSPRGGEWFQPVKGPQVNTSNPISTSSAARSTEFRARHCGFLIPFALKHTNGRAPPRTRSSTPDDHVSLIILFPPLPLSFPSLSTIYYRLDRNANNETQKLLGWQMPWRFASGYYSSSFHVANEIVPRCDRIPPSVTRLVDSGEIRWFPRIR